MIKIIVRSGVQTAHEGILPPPLEKFKTQGNNIYDTEIVTLAQSLIGLDLAMRAWNTVVIHSLLHLNRASSFDISFLKPQSKESLLKCTIKSAIPQP